MWNHFSSSRLGVPPQLWFLLWRWRWNGSTGHCLLHSRISWHKSLFKFAINFAFQVVQTILWEHIFMSTWLFHSCVDNDYNVDKIIFSNLQKDRKKTRLELKNLSFISDVDHSGSLSCYHRCVDVKLWIFMKCLHVD